MKTGRFSPAILLFFLSPMVGELLSGSTPPVRFFNPITLFLETALYGSGAVLCRELVYRWSKGWPSVLTLGAAYGIIEEGLDTKSFFDPRWPDVGILGSYGRALGVNWIWSLELIIYHAVFSIAIPILLVSLLFPQWRTRAWIGRKIFRVLCCFLAGSVLIGFLLFSAYRPPVVTYLLTIAVVVVLFFVAKGLPNSLARPNRLRVARPGRFWWTGFLATILFFIICWVLPATHLPAPLTALALVGLVFFTGKMLMKAVHSENWMDSHKLALAAGALSFFILLSPLQEFIIHGRQDTQGMTAIGVIFAVALALLAWLIRRRGKSAQPYQSENGVPG